MCRHLDLKLVPQEDGHLLLVQPWLLEQMVAQSAQHRRRDGLTPPTSVRWSSGGVEVSEIGPYCLDRALAAASHHGHLSSSKRPRRDHVTNQVVLRGSKVRGHVSSDKAYVELE